MWDFVVDKSGAGAGFLLELQFPLSIYIPSASPQSSSLSPEAGTIGQEWHQIKKIVQKLATFYQIHGVTYRKTITFNGNCFIDHLHAEIYSMLKSFERKLLCLL
jgi:hypothetical protein